VKFQKRNPDKCVPESQKNKEKILWDGRKVTYLEYKKEIEFNRNDYAHIDVMCKTEKIKWFASVWDLDSAAFMKQFSNIVKIPSALITHLELLKYCRENYDTVLISTGMSTEGEIEKAVEIGDPDVIFHTNSCYPSPNNELHLGYIDWLQEKYPDKEIGYSGHEINLLPSMIAISKGIKWLERHITLNREMWGSDQLASVEPEGMMKLVKDIRRMMDYLDGNEPRKIYKSEKKKKNSLRKESSDLIYQKGKINADIQKKEKENLKGS